MGVCYFYLYQNLYKFNVLFKSSNCIFVRIENYKTIIGLVYANINNLEVVLKNIEEFFSIILIKFPNEKVMIGGDFKSRVAE